MLVSGARPKSSVRARSILGPGGRGGTPQVRAVAIDDLGLAPLTSTERHHLLEVLKDRTERAATLITSQVPVRPFTS